MSLRAMVLWLSTLLLLYARVGISQDLGNDSYPTAASSSASVPALVRLPSVDSGIKLASATAPQTSEPLPSLSSGAPASSLESQVNDVLRRLQTLEQKSAKPSAEKTPSEEWVDMSAEKWTVKLGGHVQPDLILWANRDPNITSPLARNYFEFRRLRLVADGTGYGVYDFRLQLTLEPEVVNDTLGTTAPGVKDAYFSINEVPWIGRARIGNFFVPTSLEQVTNDTNTVFLERSVPSQGTYSVDREPGICFYNCTEDLNFTWTTGIFIDNISDAIQERIDNNLGYRLAGRVTWLPYYDEPSKGRYLVHVGADILHTDDHDDRARFRARPQIHEGPILIDSGIFDAKYYTTGSAEFATVLGPLCVQSEIFLTSVQQNTGGPATISGAYAYATYCLTGENRNFDRFGQHGAQFGRFTPYNNVYWLRGGSSWGAWEVKARWSNVGLSQLDAGIYNDFTFGFNWYWSDRVRCLLDWIHPITTAQTVYGATKSNIIGMRFDFNW